MVITDEFATNLWAGFDTASKIRPDLFPKGEDAQEFFHPHALAMQAGEYSEVSYGGFTLKYEDYGDDEKISLSLDLMELVRADGEAWAYSAFADEDTARLFNI